MRNGLKALLFLSAFSPALVSVGAARLISGGQFWDAIYYVVAGAMGSLSAVYILAALKWHGESFPFQAKKIESNDALLLGIIATYIFPFFLRAADITVGIVIGILIALWVVFWFTDAPTPSPLLRILGLRFYKVESINGMVYTLIARREILDPSNVKMVKKISGSMLLKVDQ
jgi:hypothetical protein